jgi:hypothetical protein
LLGDRENRRDVIARMASIEIEKVVVVVQLPDSRTIGPGRPFAMHGPGPGQPNDASPFGARVSERLCASTHDRIAIESCDGRGGGVNQTILDDLDNVRLNRDRVTGDFSDTPRELRLPVESLARCSHSHLVVSHSFTPSPCAAQMLCADLS